jgi:transposase
LASVNKHSLREEFDTLKARFEQLSAAGKMPEESRTLFQAMLMLFELLMAVFMEKRTTKDSSNSSLPSSQTEKDDTATTRPGAQSKGKSHDDHRSGNTRTLETTQVVSVAQCQSCGEDLSDTPCQGHERRTLIDIIFEKVVTHVDAEIKQCPSCQAQSKGRFPAEMPGPLQYGLGIKAYVLNLLIAQMLSLKRVQQSIRTLIGMAISETTILKYVMQLHRALAAWEQSAMEQLLTMPAMHVDETSLRVDRKNHWIHVCSAGEITLKFVHPKRGREAIEAIGVIPRYGGVVIHDCWASYLAYDHCGHGLCGSHLLRELTFIIDANGYAWAANMKRLLQATCSRVSKRKRKKLTQDEYKHLQKHYRTILTRGKKELPPIPPRQNGKRGRIAKSDAHNLWERLKQHETAVLLFAKLSHVAFTNNRAERDLRMSKVKQKVSGCFRTSQYAEAYCRISSYLQTMANQGYNPLVAIQLALSGQLYAEGGG